MNHKDNFDYFLEEKQINTYQLVKEIVNQEEHRVFYFKDLESRFLYVNDAFVSKFNLKSRDEVIGKTDYELFTHCPEHAKLAYRDEQEIIATGKAIDILEYEGIRDGIERVVRTHKYPLYDHQHHICGTFGISEDISMDLQIIQEERQKEIEMAQQIHKLNEKVNEDALSKLKNARYAKRRYRYLYQQFIKEYIPFSIILLDSDNFKQVNDAFGHMIGDLVIKYIGKILLSIKEIYKNELNICRIGGDEFLVILPSTTIKDAADVAFMIKEAFEQHPFCENEILTNITFSMGVGEIQLSETLEDFLHRVDTHLYRAKRNGKNDIDFNVSNLI